MNEPSLHWESVYARNDAQSVSWYTAHLHQSLQLLRQAGLHAGSALIDVGAGASTLVDDLLAVGVVRITAVDLSESGLRVAQQRLGAHAAAVEWRVGDITQMALPAAAYDLWHDRAVLHFLTTPTAVAAYAAAVHRSVRPGGHAVIGGFAPDGPLRCSGLDVARRSAADIATAIGGDFTLVAQADDLHTTPSGRAQHFAYAVLRRL